MKYLQQQKEYKKAIEILKEVFERKKTHYNIFNIPEVNNPKEMKDYLWTDVSTSHLFKSREELDTKWKVEIN